MNAREAISNVRAAQGYLEAAQDFFSDEGKPQYPKLIKVTNDLRDVIRQIEGDVQAAPTPPAPPAPQRSPRPTTAQDEAGG